MSVLERDPTACDGATEHVGAEAGALFVGEEADLDRSFRLDAPLVERAHDLERAEHSERAIECTAGRHAVDVGSGNDRLERTILSSADTDRVADAIDANGETCFLEPPLDETPSFAVRGCEREPIHPD